ncbi:MAG: hypothetical protein OXL37_03595 [Chloroflexota bacterium]|nr:hypothetical protein [Chloroflexota bacterium]MDE2958599.1 hypothetical protein [Chloroflexota bacterium]
MHRVAHILLMAAAAALWMSIGAVVTLITQGNLEAASDLLWAITAAGGAAAAVTCLIWANVRWAKRHRCGATASADPNTDTKTENAA